MHKLTQVQEKVLESAVNEMKNQSWFNGVCLDSFKHLTDYQIEKMGFKKAVEEVVFDTMSWDAW